jgi:hypothetical protein
MMRWRRASAAVVRMIVGVSQLAIPRVGGGMGGGAGEAQMQELSRWRSWRGAEGCSPNRSSRPTRMNTTSLSRQKEACGRFSSVAQRGCIGLPETEESVLAVPWFLRDLLALLRDELFHDEPLCGGQVYYGKGGYIF